MLTKKLYLERATERVKLLSIDQLLLLSLELFKFNIKAKESKSCMAKNKQKNRSD